MVIVGVDYGHVMLCDILESNYSGLDVYVNKFDYGLN